MARRRAGTLLEGRPQDDPLSAVDIGQLRPGQFAAVGTQPGRPDLPLEFSSNIPGLADESTVDLSSAEIRPPASPEGFNLPRPTATATPTPSAAQIAFRNKRDVGLGSSEAREERQDERDAIAQAPVLAAEKVAQTKAAQEAAIEAKVAPVREQGKQARLTQEEKQKFQAAETKQAFDQELEVIAQEFGLEAEASALDFVNEIDKLKEQGEVDKALKLMDVTLEKMKFENRTQEKAAEQSLAERTTKTTQTATTASGAKTQRESTSVEPEPVTDAEFDEADDILNSAEFSRLKPASRARIEATVARFKKQVR